MPGRCPRCTKAVYQAEEVKSTTGVYHRLCFSCSACKKQLDQGTVTEHQQQIFCKSCYGKNFGPKGYGYGVGAGTLSMDQGTISRPLNNNSISEKVVKHSTSSSGELKATCCEKRRPKFGGGEICAKCGKTVYFAEAMKADGNTWHKTCFTCILCNKMLDSCLVCEKEGNIYCKSCYGKNFGPKGVGFGIGAGTLQTK